MKQVQKVLLQALSSVGRVKVRGLPRALVIVLMLLIIGSVVLYLAGWIWLWAALRHVDLPALNALLQTLTGASFIAAIGFIGKGLIDNDGDGIPDQWDQEGETNEGIYQSGPRPERGPGPWSGKPEQWRQGK